MEPDGDKVEMFTSYWKARNSLIEMKQLIWVGWVWNISFWDHSGPVN